MKLFPEVLVADDNAMDLARTLDGLRRFRPDIHLKSFADGDGFWDHIRDMPAASERPDMHPQLVLLDIRLRGLDGLEVLRRVREGKHCAGTPFVVFTASQSPEDYRRACECRANSFVLKPDGTDAYLDTVRRIAAYWFEANLTPLSL